MFKSNAMSCVLKITDAQGVAALLVGDIEQAQERELLARNALGPVSYLLVPHHGSKTSSSAAFLDALTPQVAVVQSGIAIASVIRQATWWRGIRRGGFIG